MLGVVEFDKPEPPIGQFFLLRAHLRNVFDRATFEDEGWTSCAAAFLAYPGIPVLANNGTTDAPATFFRRLFEPRPGDPATATPMWAALLRQLESLGDTRVRQLIATDNRSSWVIFLSADLSKVLAYGGRKLPGPQYSMAEDDKDLSSGVFVREVLAARTPMRLTRLRQNKLDAIVELIDTSGNRFTVEFDRALRVRVPEPANEEIQRLVELSGLTGRKWFVFEPVDPDGGRVLAIQASAASWRQGET